jgi:hypothetical protein
MTYSMLDRNGCMSPSAPQPPPQPQPPQPDDKFDINFDNSGDSQFAE